MANKTRERLMNQVKSDSKAIALIYSPIELHEYIVEIIAKNSDEFIHKGKELWHFNSIPLVKVGIITTIIILHQHARACDGGKLISLIT